jgi:hypothetical protein
MVGYHEHNALLMLQHIFGPFDNRYVPEFRNYVVENDNLYTTSTTHQENSAGTK